MIRITFFWYLLLKKKVNKFIKIQDSTNSTIRQEISFYKRNKSLKK